MWTNDRHHLLRRAVTVNPLIDDVMYISTERGPWFFIETVYGYLIVAVTIYY